MKSILKRVFWLVGGIVLSVALVEVALRFFPEPRFASNVVFDPLLGNRGPKEAFVEHRMERMYYNQFGFRDRSYDPDKERLDGKVKVVALGDSITEAIEVEVPLVWTKWVDNILNVALKTPSTMYRLASSDWGTYQELLALDREGSEVGADVVILQFLGLNDYINNGFSFAGKNRSENDGWRPYFESVNPEKPRYQHPWRHALRSWSRVFWFLDAFYINNYIYGSKEIFWRDQKCDPYLNLFREDVQDSAWKEAYSTTNALASQFGLRKGKYKSILAVYFPSNIEIIDEVWKGRVEDPLRECFPEANVNRRMPELVFENAFRSAGVETLSLSESFLREKHRYALFYPSGHLSPKGHQVAGEQIAFYLYNRHTHIFGGKKLRGK